MIEPIAIIGRACLLPGAHSPGELWQHTLTAKDCLSHATTKQWGIDPQALLSHYPLHPDSIWTDRIGSIDGFETRFNPADFAIPAKEILKLDVLCQWLLHTGREALQNAGYTLPQLTKIKTGVIIGNLSYPTHSLSRFAESVWLGAQQPSLLYDAIEQPHPINRFMSGLPVQLMARGLQLTSDAFGIDAACASSLYAIQLACDRLQDGTADLMLAGGVNAADSLFLQMGFAALQALSKSGCSLPFHQQADGLIPSQGAAIIVMKRLADAVRDSNHIYGVIRGIGLSNDGSSKGFLAPSEEGQIAAMKQAYEMAGLCPEDISWVECHATGTPLGDATEVRSMRQIFTQPVLTVGALKANIGHTITTSGAAALINVLSAFAAKTKPPTRQSSSDPMAILKNTPFQLLDKPTPWEEKHRRAAINCFGFGGNNAHLLVEEWKGLSSAPMLGRRKNSDQHSADSDIAIVGLGVVATGVNNLAEFSQILFQNQISSSDAIQSQSLTSIELDIRSTPFPPADLQRTLGQQLAVLKASQEALASIKQKKSDRTSVFIGMQCDADIARGGLRWRLPALLPQADAAWIAKARDQIYSPLQAADIIGNMPNIVTNRINQVFDFKAPSYSVSAEELSGLVALQIGIQALQKKNIDMAVVGAVDMSCEVVHQTAAKYICDETRQIPGDAAVVFILKRLDDAKRDQETIYGVLDSANSTSSFFEMPISLMTSLLGYAHAASGLLQLLAATLVCYQRLLPPQQTDKSLPWAVATPCAIKVSVTSLSRHQMDMTVQESPVVTGASRELVNPLPKIFIYSGDNRYEIAQALNTNQQQRIRHQGPVKLAIVAYDEKERQQKEEIAKAFLKGTSHQPLLGGIYFREKPLKGEMAFVFTGALTTYPDMGRELLMSFPALLASLANQVQSLSDIVTLLYTMEEKNRLTMFEELKTYSFLTQIHARLSQDIFQLKPHACIGYCSGETNSLLALKAWKDMEQLFLDVEASRIYTQTLSGNFTVLDKNWRQTNEPQWVTWRLLTNVETVKAALKDEPFVRLTIINSPGDCIIAGRPDACERLIRSLHSPHAKSLSQSMVIHCKEFSPLASLWRKLHYRKTYAVPDVRFYSTGTGQPYVVNADSAADALLSQASSTVDFPRVVRRAWQDGVRIFLEHGPRGLCSRWINEILQDQEHVAIPLDVMQVNPVTQAAHAVAQLLVAGINEMNYRCFTG